MVTFLLMYAVLGVAVGILAGLLGIGGGIVIIPMLHFAFEVQQIAPEVAHKLALGTSMASIVFTAISSTLAHHRHGGVVWQAVRNVTPGILLGTFVGSFLAARLPAHYLQLIFVVFLSYVIYSMLVGSKPKPSRHLPGFAGMSVAGSGIGLLSSLVGIGGGTISVPYLLWHNVEMCHAVGTSAAIGFPIAVGGCFGYILNGIGVPMRPDYSLGFVYLPCLIPLVVMSMLTAPLGARLAHTIPVPRLKKCFALLLIVVAVKMLMTALEAF